MTTKAEREAAYRALVKLGVPIPPNEIDAVLEAAEGARGVPVETEIERLRGLLKEAEIVLRAVDYAENSKYTPDAKYDRARDNALHLVRAFLATLPIPQGAKP